MAAADKHASVLKQVSSMKKAEQDWPALPLGEWESTYRTLHMWTQIVGKIRLGLTPLLNHWWNVALYVNPRGLTPPTTRNVAPASRAGSQACCRNLRRDPRVVDHQVNVQVKRSASG